ncbi:profilin, required for normal timing of actin polymerization in response to thermal stress [Malassezia vespertilionis]|uniref:Profilin n=1 Tax=Malassezia vespertilionis TaxID=2020962 RepID=A0A2N1JFN4_9BASI|nr:profilin, required for normal timing of actin polymerization in response to thermal stress [Malassezia vespertilionis]PKI85348.1 Pfy1p [Malassezia vespertilionis]WFD04815.1 profilin, required for normal timing of actin polymerization in response to thermal stress [Malassezia vespertilionis]
MSWQGYVDTNLVGTGKVSQAAIIGLKGGVWASSAGFTISPEEQQAAISGFDEPSPLQANGIHVNGKKYLALQANPRSIYGKVGGDGVCMVKTNQAVLIGAYQSPILPGDANKVVEGLADYLISVGY